MIIIIIVIGKKDGDGWRLVGQLDAQESIRTVQHCRSSKKQSITPPPSLPSVCVSTGVSVCHCVWVCVSVSETARLDRTNAQSLYLLYWHRITLIKSNIPNSFPMNVISYDLIIFFIILCCLLCMKLKLLGNCSKTTPKLL